MKPTTDPTAAALPRLSALAVAAQLVFFNSVEAAQPNIVLCMADDQGWGDTAYNGHPLLKTPHLDETACGRSSFRPFLCSRPRLFADAWQRVDRSASESIRMFCMGAYTAAAGDHDCRAASSGRIRHGAFWQMASWISAEGQSRESRQQRIRSLVVSFQFLRQRSDPQSRRNSGRAQGRKFHHRRRCGD